MNPVQLEFNFRDEEKKKDLQDEEGPGPLPWETPEYIESMKNEANKEGDF